MHVMHAPPEPERDRTDPTPMYQPAHPAAPGDMATERNPLSQYVSLGGRPDVIGGCVLNLGIFGR